MKILIVEDMFERQEIFKENLKNDDLFFANNVLSAIDFLKENTFDLIYLDYDLGDSSCGGRVATHIAINDIQSKVIIHSMNPVGADEIKRIIPQSIKIPFFNLF